MSSNLVQTSGMVPVRFEGGDSLARIERTFDNLVALLQARTRRREQLLAEQRRNQPTRSEAFRQCQHEKWLGSSKAPIVPTPNKTSAPPKDMHRRILQDPNG